MLGARLFARLGGAVGGRVDGALPGGESSDGETEWREALYELAVDIDGATALGLLERSSRVLPGSLGCADESGGGRGTWPRWEPGAGWLA